MTKGQKRLLWTCFLVPVLAAVAFVSFVVLNPFHAHEHCIKNSGLALRIYSTDHQERFPAHTNGFGSALLILLQEDYLGPTNKLHSARLITAPGDDGQIFLDALRTGTPVPEEKCSRIYVQGLSETNNPNIAILFDKYPTRGGDHRRRPWGPLLREVCLLDGSMQIVREEDWPAFASNQVQMLIHDGIQPSLAQHYYRLAEVIK